MRKSGILIMLMALLAFCSCTNDEQFRINGTIEGNPTMNLRIGYYASNAYQSSITAAREGKFEIFGVSPTPAVVDIMDYDSHLLGRTYIANGQAVALKLQRNNPYAIEASGNDVAEAWAAALRQNADSLLAGGRAANAAVAAYVEGHPESIVSTLLLVGEYDAGLDPVGADSLMELIDPAARPAALTEGFNYMLQRLVLAIHAEELVPFPYFDRRDSLRMFDPSEHSLTLVAVDNNRSGRSDSIVPVLKRLRREYPEKLGILEFSVDADTIEWKRNTRNDTATWHQAWGAGGVAARGIERLGVASVPFFIVCDSVGVQLLRTRQAAEAERFIGERLSQ